MEIIIAILVLLIAPVTAQARVIEIPKEQYLWEFRLSRYYSPSVGQKEYYQSREHDLQMNCGWNEESCKYPADGKLLTNKDIGYAYSCPKSILLGTKIKLVFHWWVVYWECRDRWWAIKNKRLDARCWYGDEWLRNINDWKGCYTGKADVYKL